MGFEAEQDGRQFGFVYIICPRNSGDCGFAFCDGACFIKDNAVNFVSTLKAFGIFNEYAVFGAAANAADCGIELFYETVTGSAGTQSSG